jgi:hypothetical protein
MPPKVNHFTGNSLITEYIETYVCPTIVSTDFTGKKQFRFRDDNRPVIAFLTAENEYSSNITLPEFAHDLLLTKNVNCEFAVGKPVDTGDDRHNLENLQILEDADLVVIYIRRRGLEPKKMDLIKAYVNSGRPVLGIRTASHAFDPRIKPEQSKGNAFLSSLASWPEFDRDILGGNYQDHFGSNTVTTVSGVPGMEGHPLLKDVSLEGFTTSSSLYRNRNLRSEKAQVILTGTITGQPSQPILWINTTGRTNAIYFSLGSIADFKNETYRQILKNCTDYLLNPGNK